MTKSEKWTRLDHLGLLDFVCSGVTGGCQAWFTPKVPGVQIQGKGVEGDLVHQHTKHQQVTVSYGRAYAPWTCLRSDPGLTLEGKSMLDWVIVGCMF